MQNKLKRKGLSQLNENLFYKQVNKFSVYVEGDIDKLFWQGVFSHVSNVEVKCKVLIDKDGNVITGWENLLNYIESHKINVSKIPFIVAIDGDYDSIIKNKPNYQYLIKTDRYSLENYLFCHKNINIVLNKLSYGEINDEDKVKNRIDRALKNIFPLILLDCINMKNDMGLNVFQMHKIHNIKTLDELEEYKNDLNVEDYQSEMSKLSLSQDEFTKFIRWKEFKSLLNKHILHQLKLINKKLNRTRKNNPLRTSWQRASDELYTDCIGLCENCTNKCIDYNNLIQKAQNVVNKLTA